MQRWKGTFNWHGEVHILYTTAKNKPTATMNMIAKLTRKLGKAHHGTLLNYFYRETVDNYKVEEVM